ncbi:hypothetical protein BC829DRAFT_422411 [Chytridium lagenaria]|nr:hypothetical protein BC829DRAFT_422411 [Chytridium lagenaria]
MGSDNEIGLSSFRQILTQLSPTGGARHTEFGKLDIQKATESTGINFPKFLGVFEKTLGTALNTLPALFDELLYDFDTQQMLGINDNELMQSLERSLLENVKDENKEMALKFLNMFTVESQATRLVQSFQNKIGFTGKGLSTPADVIEAMVLNENPISRIA